MVSHDQQCDEDYRRILQNNEKNITRLTNLECLLPVLRTKWLLTENELRLLREMPQYEIHRTSKLVQILLTKGGRNAVDLFIEALQDEKEHIGHNELAKVLLQEVSIINRPKPAKKPPPTLPRKAKLSQTQAPHQFSTPQPIRKQPLLPPTKNRSASITELNAELDTHKAELLEKIAPKKFILDVQHPEKADSQQQLFNDVYLSAQLKQIHSKLDTNSQSHQQTLTIVQQLATVILDMQEKMENMQQLLHSLLDDRQANEEECDTSQKGNVLKQVVHTVKHHDYVDNPVTQIVETDQYDYVKVGSTTTAVSEYTSLIKKPVERVYENSSSLHKFNQANYVDSKLLARGHSGDYWLAVSKVDRSKVVIKKPAATVTTEMLGHEVNALLKCKHPNVIHFIMADMNATDQVSLYFEYAEKGQLKSYLQSEKANITLTKLLAMAANVACGMAELEKHKIIHCDLKASNVLLDGDYLCKIASFNKAQCLKDNEKHRICDLYHLSPRRQAPEVLSSQKFSTKSDVWAFGVLMAELFSFGSKPYPTMKDDEVRKFVLGRKKMAQPTRCPKDVYNLMKECFHYREDQRFPFTAVQKALKELHSKSFKKDSDSSVSEFED